MTQPKRTVIWIDAAPPASRTRLFGLSLVERHLRMIRHLGLRPAEIRIDHASASPPEIEGDGKVDLHAGSGDCGARLEAYRKEAGEAAVIALPGDAVVDQRLLQHLWDRSGSAVAFGGEAAARAAVLRLTPEAPAVESAENLVPLAEAARAAGVHAVTPDEVPRHIRRLRRDQDFYLFAVPDAAARAQAERFLFWSNYKGSTDLLTRYVFPPAVWVLTRWFARWRVHPNSVTIFSILLAVAAVPLFALGAWLWGLLAAYGMAVLDSVDGKLARLTYTDSKLGNVLDHGLDVVHPPFWYMAMAWGLAGSAAAPVFQASLAIFAVYVLDRLATAAYSVVFGRTLHAHAPIDAKLRTWLARRNINLLIFTIALAAGYGEAGIYAILAWHALTLLYHGGRSGWLIATRRRASA